MLLEEDLKYIIEGLPGWLQPKYYGMLRDLILDGKFFLNPDFPDRMEMTEEEYNKYLEDNPL